MAITGSVTGDSDEASNGASDGIGDGGTASGRGPFAGKDQGRGPYPAAQDLPSAGRLRAVLRSVLRPRPLAAAPGVDNDGFGAPRPATRDPKTDPPPGGHVQACCGPLRPFGDRGGRPSTAPVNGPWEARRAR